MSHKTEIDLIVPDVSVLCCINCKINPEDMFDRLIKSLYHGQILYCRLIIYTVRCCIASPSIKNVEDSIHVIVSKKFYSTGKLQKHLLDLKIQFTDPEPVHSKIYEACLKYTFTFKMSPLWNLVGKTYYLCGFNFLSLPCVIDAIEWNILFKGNDTRLEIKPMKINLFPFTLEYLSLPPSIVNNFMTSPHCTKNSINLRLFQCPFVYVLPRLTKARIISVSKSLPDSCPFDSYSDLRRHWKNMYSYYLPKCDQGMLFYEVVFSINPNQKFTYPENCIMSKLPEFLMCEKKNEITSQFIKDLSTNVHSVCGQVIKMGRLFPELNIEYSCIFKQRSNNFNKHSSNESSSPFFNTNMHCVMKPVDKKLHLSSLIMFKGIDKMKTPMKKQTQDVLAITNRKRKKSPLAKNNDQHATEFYHKIRKCNLEDYNTKNFQNVSLPIQQLKTAVDNADDICSFYDIPCMYENNLDRNNIGLLYDNTLMDSISDEMKYIRKNKIVHKKNEYHLQRNSRTPVKEDLKIQANKSLNNKPIIKTVENVCYDLTGIKTIKNTNVIERLSAKLKYHGIRNLCETTRYFDLSSNSNTSNQSIGKYSYKSNEANEVEQECEKYNLNDQNQLQYNFQNPDLSVNKNTRSVIENSSKKPTNDNKDIKECQNELRSLLSSLDLHNAHNLFESNINKTIQEKQISQDTKIIQSCQEHSDLTKNTIPNLYGISKSFTLMEHKSNNVDQIFHVNQLNNNKSTLVEKELNNSQELINNNWIVCDDNKSQSHLCSKSHSPILSSFKKQTVLSESITNLFGSSTNSNNEEIIKHDQKEIVKTNELDFNFQLQKVNSNFLDILSESSDESNFESYENYKETCTEVFTF